MLMTSILLRLVIGALLVPGLASAGPGVTAARASSGERVPGRWSSDDAVTAAIVRAVQTRMGRSVEVTVTDLAVRGEFSENEHIVATLDPAARAGVRTRVG